MLPKETKDKLVALGFDVSKLEEAVKSEDEQSLDVPTLYSEQQYNDFGGNRFKEGKNAFSEIKAKEIRDKFKLQTESKDIDEVMNGIIEMKIAEVNKDPDERVKALKSDKESLQSLLEAKTKELDEAKIGFDNERLLNPQFLIIPLLVKIRSQHCLCLHTVFIRMMKARFSSREEAKFLKIVL